MKLFDFLNRFVNQTKMLNNSEAQDVIALQTFLEDPANTQFCINLSGASRNGGIHFWAEAIMYLLNAFKYNSAMCEVLEDVHNIKQESDEK